ANFATYLFPNLELFNARGAAVHGIVPGVSQFGFGFLYAALYASAVLGAAVLVFRRREFR
ncbi:MAG TPA: hypothetical protein VK943_09055, partial [Arenibaculum sp.]|nr:hypothetical protein [Arenibaculum sp.]